MPEETENTSETLQRLARTHPSETKKAFPCPHPSVKDPTQHCSFSSNQKAGLNRHINQTHLGRPRRGGLKKKGRPKGKATRPYKRRAPAANGLRPVAPPPVAQVVQFCPACGLDLEILAQAIVLAQKKQA